jgi:hypothetical protein
MYANVMPLCGLTILPSFMKAGIGVQAILRFRLSSLYFCNIVINYGC